VNFVRSLRFASPVLIHSKESALEILGHISFEDFADGVVEAELLYDQAYRRADGTIKAPIPFYR